MCGPDQFDPDKAEALDTFRSTGVDVVKLFSSLLTTAENWRECLSLPIFTRLCMVISVSKVRTKEPVQ